MAQESKTRLLDAERSEKRKMILSEAITLFNDKGYFDTRLEDVAMRLGTAKTSISYHFKSKEALLFEAYSETCDFAEAEIQLAADAPDGRSRVLRWIRAYAQAQSASVIGRGMPMAVIGDPFALGEEDRPVIAERLARHARALREFLLQGQRDGTVRVQSVDATTFFLLSVQQWLRRWLKNVVPSDHDDAIDGLTDLLENGLLADKTAQLPVAQPKSANDVDDLLFDRETRNRMKHEAFLRVGTRHLNQQGYRNLSVNDVAAELGVSRGVFYYHFEDKDELLKSCVKRSLDLMEEVLERYRDDRGNAGAQLHLALTSLYEGHSTDLNPLVRLSLLSSLGPKDRPVALARARRVTAGFGELVAMGMADGSIRPFDLEAVEHLVCGAVYGATRQRFRIFGLDTDPADTGPLNTAAAYFEPLFRGLKGGG